MEDTGASTFKCVPVTATGSKRLPSQIPPASFGNDQAAWPQTDAKIKQTFSPKRLAPAMAEMPNAVGQGKLADSRIGSNFSESKGLEVRSKQPSRYFSHRAKDAPLEFDATMTENEETDSGAISSKDRTTEHDAAADFLDDFDKWLDDTVTPGD